MAKHPPWETLAARERRLWAENLVVAGVDEVGRGALAGPVVACAVILPPGRPWLGLDDSKRLTPRQREALYQDLVGSGVCVGLGAAGPRAVERENVYQATARAMRRAIGALSVAPDWVLTDAMPLELEVPLEALVQGDARSASVAAASVVAKVMRDRYMTLLDQQFPGYDFWRHKGYGTRAHYQALDLLGTCPAHRRTFLGSAGGVVGSRHGRAEPLL